MVVLEIDIGNSRIKWRRFANDCKEVKSRGINLDVNGFLAEQASYEKPSAVRLSNVADRKISSKRVHVVRVIGLAKSYKILTTKMDSNRTPFGGRIIFVCFALCNLRVQIIAKSRYLFTTYSLSVRHLFIQLKFPLIKKIYLRLIKSQKGLTMIFHLFVVHLVFQ